MTDRSGVWDSLERWRSVAFLAAGGAFLVIAINTGLRWVANTGMNLSPLVHIGLVLLIYVGILGMSPRLIARAPRVGRLSQVLVAVFALEIVLTFAAVAGGLVPGSIPRVVFALIVMTSMIGVALTLTVVGVASLRTGSHSRAVGVFLLLAAFGVSVAIAKAILFGDFGGPEWVSLVSDATFAISLIAVGYGLRTEGRPTEQPESTETVA